MGTCLIWNKDMTTPEEKMCKELINKLKAHKVFDNIFN